MRFLLRHVLLTLSVSLLLGHNVVAHAHGCEASGVHSSELIHQLGDFFGTDLGEGHLEHFSRPESGAPDSAQPPVLPALQPAIVYFIPANFAPGFVPASGDRQARPLHGHGQIRGLRGPPAGK